MNLGDYERIKADRKRLLKGIAFALSFLLTAWTIVLAIVVGAVYLITHI